MAYGQWYSQRNNCNQFQVNSCQSQNQCGNACILLPGYYGTSGSSVPTTLILPYFFNTSNNALYLYSTTASAYQLASSLPNRYVFVSFGDGFAAVPSLPYSAGTVYAVCNANCFSSSSTVVTTPGTNTNAAGYAGVISSSAPPTTGLTTSSPPFWFNSTNNTLYALNSGGTGYAALTTQPTAPYIFLSLANMTPTVYVGTVNGLSPGMTTTVVQPIYVSSC